MFDKNLAKLNEGRVGLNGLNGVNGKGEIHDDVKIIESNNFRFTYAYELGEKVEIISKSAWVMIFH